MKRSLAAIYIFSILGLYVTYYYATIKNNWAYVGLLIVVFCIAWGMYVILRRFLKFRDNVSSHSIIIWKIVLSVWLSLLLFSVRLLIFHSRDFDVSIIWI